MKSQFVKTFSTDVDVYEGERAIKAKISTGTLDRDNEVLVPQGCNSQEFEANPVVYLNHNYYTLPIGKCVGLDRKGNSIIAKTVLAERPEDYPRDAEWVPDTLLSLFKQGIIKGFSVGFDPMDGGTREPTEKDKDNYGPSVKRIYSKWKLIEYSVAPLPANQEALCMAVSKGMKRTESILAMFGNFSLPAPVKQENTSAPARRIIKYYSIPAEIKPIPSASVDVDKVIADAVAKKRGRVYQI